MMEQERAEILRMLKEHLITAEEAAVLLSALKGFPADEEALEDEDEEEVAPAGGGSGAAAGPEGEGPVPTAAVFTPVSDDRPQPSPLPPLPTVLPSPDTAERKTIAPAASLGWESVAVIAGGMIILLLGTILIAGVYLGARSFGWVLFCGLPLIALGTLAVAAGWWIRSALWLRVDIRERKGTRLRLGFPVPWTILQWGMKIGRHYTPREEQTKMDQAIEFLRAAEEEMKAGRPFTVDVVDDEDGDEVHVWLGPR